MFFGMCNSPEHFKQWWILFSMTWFPIPWSLSWTTCLSLKKTYHHWSRIQDRSYDDYGTTIIFETVKMWISQNEDWISWNDHRRRKNIYGYFEIERNSRLAHSFYRQTSQRIFRIWKLLSMIYSKLLWHRTTPKRTFKERQKIHLDPWMSIFLWWDEETIHRRTGLGHVSWSVLGHVLSKEQSKDGSNDGRLTIVQCHHYH